MSSDALALSRGFSGLRARGGGGAVGAQGEPSSGSGGLTAPELDAIVRAAEERGAQRAALEGADLLKAVSAQLAQRSQELAEARRKDLSRLEEFGVRLACTIAEELVHTTIREEAHDVKGIVRRVLDVLGPDLEPEGATVLLNSEDLERLTTEQITELRASGIDFVASTALTRGSVKLTSGGAEFYSDLNRRLEVVRERLITEAGNHGEA